MPMTALTALTSIPSVALAPHATPVERLERLEAALGPAAPRLFVKRDDLLAFAMGGNKVRKMQTVLAEAMAAGADTLITCGGVQSNHARVTAAAGARAGLDVILVSNGTAPDPLTGNARLDRLFGATMRYVARREDRAPEMERIAAERRAAGRRPFVVPLGASTPTGVLGFAQAAVELATSSIRPDLIVHPTSSGGTQAALLLGCALLGLQARVLGISADDPAAAIVPVVAALVDKAAARLGTSAARLGIPAPEVDDRFIGEGYGIPTPASVEATELLARREGIVLDPVYTAKAAAGLISRARAGEFTGRTVLFWHTGGTPGFFA